MTTEPHRLTEIAPDIWSNGHLRFVPVANRPRPAWDIILNRDPPGAPVAHLRWNSIWKEYALLTREGYVFAHDCLADISQLLIHLNSAA